MSTKSFRSNGLLIAIGLAALLAALLAIVFRPTPVSPASFRQIRIGMTEAELHQLLGAPGYEEAQLGLVETPEKYVLNFSMSSTEKRKRGFQDYRFQQWTSQRMAIIAIVGSEGRVVCRYSTDQKDWRGTIRSWVSEWF